MPAQFHVTVPPVWTTLFCGVKWLSSTLTVAAVGGVVAVSVKVAGPARPLKVALTRWSVADPTESVVLATPLAWVVLWVGVTAPSPDVTAHVMTTPGTARPSTSTTVTLKGAGSGLLKYQL